MTSLFTPRRIYTESNVDGANFVLLKVTEWRRWSENNELIISQVNAPILQFLSDLFCE